MTLKQESEKNSAFVLGLPGEIFILEEYLLDGIHATEYARVETHGVYLRG
jgi:hypothetical protein